MGDIVNYFNGEKIQCIIGVVASIIFISASVYFLFLQKSLLKGIAYSFLPLSLFMLIICVTVIYRTPKDLERVTTFHKEEPKKMQSEELPRMEKVMKSFDIIKKIEIGIFLVGIALAIVFWRNDLIKGIAIGLIVQGFVLYMFDHVAESRGEIYINFLKSLQ